MNPASGKLSAIQDRNSIVQQQFDGCGCRLLDPLGSILNLSMACGRPQSAPSGRFGTCIRKCRPGPFLGPCRNRKHRAGSWRRVNEGKAIPDPHPAGEEKQVRLSVPRGQTSPPRAHKSKQDPIGLRSIVFSQPLWYRWTPSTALAQSLQQLSPDLCSSTVHTVLDARDGETSTS